MAVAVGGSNGLIDRLLTLMDWAFTSTPTDLQRVDCLNALNVCEQMIAQSESLMYLSTETSITVPNGQNYLLVPAAPEIDFGKEVTVGRVAGDGVIEYLPPDKFAAIRTGSAYTINATTPVYFTILRDHTSGERRFRFKPGNTSGSSIVLPITVQRVPPALADDGASLSSLPVGYELTLLLPMAEEYLKSKRHEFGLDKLSESLGTQLAEFYNKQRSNKEKANTDRSRDSRKADRSTPNLAG